MQNRSGAPLLVLSTKDGATAQYHMTLSEASNNKQHEGNNYLPVPENKDVIF